MAYQDYDDPDLLRTVQRVQIKLLGEFDRICRQLDIPYAIYGGSAIGAVRHGGFIPWDDDTDVCLTRADYERFLTEAPALLGEEYEIHNLRELAEFPYMFTKLGAKGTKFVPVKGSTYQQPIALDVLPVDNMSDDPKQFRSQARATWFWGRLLYLHGTPRPYLTLNGPIRVPVYAATTLVHHGLRLFGVKQRWIQRKWEAAARRFEGAKTTSMTDFGMMDPLNWRVTHDELFPTTDVAFENLMVPLPNEYDTLLTRGYGDYMQLPPVEKRKNHLPYLVDLGPYATLDTPE